MITSPPSPRQYLQGPLHKQPAIWLKLSDSPDIISWFIFFFFPDCGNGPKVWGLCSYLLRRSHCCYSCFTNAHHAVLWATCFHSECAGQMVLWWEVSLQFFKVLCHTQIASGCRLHSAHIQDQVQSSIACCLGTDLLLLTSCMVWPALFSNFVGCILYFSETWSTN